MTRHVITLPNGRQCSVGKYAQAWKALLSAKQLDEGVRHDARARFPGFAYEPETAESIVHAMRGGLSERINRHIPGYDKGRKWDSGWFFWAWRCSREVNDPRRIVRVSTVPPWLRKRLAHRIQREEV